MLKQFLNHFHDHHLAAPDQKILLAVSGGIDSMTMLHLFREAKFSIGVAHGNFQLRGTESDGDEAFVKTVCEQFQIPFYAKRFDTEAYAKQNGVSIQMAARELRYAWFDEVMQQEKYDRLATAHHLNDSIETVLLNWVHGAGVHGLSGIPLVNHQIVRPMLFATREEIEQYAQEKRIRSREDKSNTTDDYQRNFTRHHIIPKLKEINPSLESTVYRGQRKVKEEIALLDKYITQWCGEHVKMKDSNILIQKHAVVNATLLWHVVKDYGFNLDQCSDIVEALSGQSGKRFLSLEYQLTLDRDHLILSPHQDLWKDVMIEAGQESALLGAWNMDIEKITSTELSSDALVAVVDADKIKFPLQWRKWKAGDFFYPLGMEHKRKLSDFLIDNKVSLADKNVVTILEAGGEVVWVVGYRIDNRFKITPQTRSVLRFSIAPYFT
jgi:tRNA(Ile)-lysidine synthase